MPHSYPTFPECLPQGTDLRSGHYQAEFATSTSEVEDVQRLRYEVFNLELGEGLEESHQTQRDIDPYDDFCHHLLVRDTRNGDIVGTYRMQLQPMATAGIGFYSDSEYQLDGFPSDIRDNACELGRACISETHRNGRVLFLLWRGLLNYLLTNNLRYFFGCCSLTSQDPIEGWALYTRLKRAGHLLPDMSIPVREAFICESEELTEFQIADVMIPRLMRLYLDYGALICSEPAIDREFKTIDFLALFDLNHLPPKLRKIFQKDLR